MENSKNNALLNVTFKKKCDLSIEVSFLFKLPLFDSSAPPFSSANETTLALEPF